MKEIKLESTIIVHDNFQAFDDKTTELILLAKKASTNAYAPYSQFFVGAAVLLDDGSMVEGNNQENAVYPLGLCAERVALFSAHSRFPKNTVKAIAITIDYDRIATDQAAFPCGSCRQSISEFENIFDQKIKIYILAKGEKVLEIESIQQLLPFAFTKELLNGAG